MTDSFDLNWSVLRIDQELTKTVLRLGLPSGITQAIFSLAMIMMQSLTNSFGGEMVIAANVIVMRVDGFAMMPNFSLAVP